MVQVGDLRTVGLVALCLVACGDEATVLRVQLVIDGTPSPLDQVQRLRLIASGPPPMAPVKAEAPRGAEELTLPAIPLGPDRVIAVEGIDGDGIVTAHGQSAPFDLSADAPRTVKVPFSSCATTLYRDADGDAYGDGKLSKTACDGTLSGYVGNKGDCNESDPDAHPGQLEFFDQPTSGTQSFDFDCDGKETGEYPDLVDCRKEPPDCVGEGWEGSVPACGQIGTFVPCDKGSCNPAPQGSPKTQRCR